nr:retrovirus-related Pol polyprotein from transposon TNT 1-94 [Tanacetum cinerariifolium]
MVKNKGLVAEAYEWDEEDVPLDDNDITKVKVLMALADDENVVVGKKSARNGEWVKISMRKVYTLLDVKDDDERKYFFDLLCIDLNYVEEQRNNLVLKHRDLVQELNTYKEQLLVLQQAKLNFLTMQHVNTKILKKNKNLRIELKELTSITEIWQNIESKVKIIDPLVAIINSSAIEYDSVDESSFCSTPLPLLGKLAGIEPVSRGEALQAKKTESFQSKRTELSNANRSKNLTKSRCSWHMTGVKSYLPKYVKQPRPKVVFGDDSTCITEGYSSIKCN